jgi:hypothetical protein
MDWFMAAMVGSIMGICISTVGTIIGWKWMRNPVSVIFVCAGLGVIAFMFIPLFEGTLGVPSDMTMTEAIFSDGQGSAVPIVENTTKSIQSVKYEPTPYNDSTPEMKTTSVYEFDIDASSYDTGALLS